MTVQSLNILLIEDDCIDRQSILRQLKQSALSTSLENTIAVAQTGEAGLSLLRDNNYDAVLLDYSLANMTGIEVLEVMNSEELLTMPVIVLSAVDDESLMLKCLEHGAEDYLVKSEVNSKILLRSIRYARERKTLQQQLLTMAKYDSLTGLANRELFTSNLNSVVSKSKRRNVPFAVMFIDLDHFKTINDTLGHATGDELLVSVGGRLSSSVRDGDMVARLGGDEFAVLLEDIKDASNASRIAEKILVDLAPVHQCGQHVINVSLSIGIATYPHCGKDCDS
ncbi:MAG: diguanylate cyclase (GGDEF)-like protein, partial [Phenylobacterium sp.]